MTDFALTDDLLQAALRADHRPLPATLPAAVREAVAASGRHRWMLPQTALRVALATGLLLPALVLSAIYVGSRPPTEPIETLPTIVSTPGPTPLGSPAPTTPDATSYAEFVDHVTQKQSQFSDVKRAFGAATYETWKSLLSQWLDEETTWLSQQSAHTCFEHRLAGWAAVKDELMTYRDGHLYGGPEWLLATQEQWSFVVLRIDGFDPTEGATCGDPAPSLPTAEPTRRLASATPEPPVVSFSDFSVHVRESIETFEPAAARWTCWVRFLDCPDARQELGDWTATEIIWLHDHQPDGCFEARWQEWANAFAEAQSSSGATAPFGGTTPDEMDRWLAAAHTIEAFDPDTGGDVCDAASFADFRAHIDDAKAAFEGLEQAFDYVVAANAAPQTGDPTAGLFHAMQVYINWKDLSQAWLTRENSWQLDWNRAKCLDRPLSRWERLHQDISDFVGATVRNGAPGLIEAAPDWPALADRVRRFDPSSDSAC